MSYWDAHCHLAFLPGDDAVAAAIHRARARGISAWIQGGYDPADWRRQSQLWRAYPEAVWPVYGLHPWRVKTLPPADVEAALEELEETGDGARGWGETGLDFVVAQTPEDRERQLTVFRRHLDLAARKPKPLILHVVRAHGPVLAELERRPGVFAGWVHGFSGEPEVARRYVKAGFLPSVGPGVLSSGFAALKRSITALDAADLLVESDSPDRPGAEARLERLWEVATVVGRLKGMTAEAVLAASRARLERFVRG